MRADVVEPVGLNANWSQNEFEYSGLRRMGYKNVISHKNANFNASKGIVLMLKCDQTNLRM